MHITLFGIHTIMFAVTHLLATKLGLSAGLAALGMAAAAGEGRDTIEFIPPEKIKVSSNVRFNLKPARVARLAEQILETEGNTDPITVFLLPTPENGFTHGLITGGYRTASTLKLNKEKAAGLPMRAFVVPAPDTATLVKMQIQENQERENMSTIDTAIAIKQALDAGIPKPEVRKMFARPNAKGKLEQASNAFVNMMLSFLDFPKAIQGRIHNGEIGVKAAYELRKAASDKWDEILKRLESDRLEEIEFEAKAEEKYLAEVAKDEKKNKKVIELAQTLEEATKAHEAAKKLAAEKKAEAVAAYNETKADVPADIKNATDAKKLQDKRKELFKGAEKAADAAKKEEQKAKVELDKLTAKKETIEENQRQAKAKADAKKKEAAAAKPVTQTDVKKATAKVAPGTAGAVPLSKADIMDAVNILALPGNPPKVKALGEIFKQHFQGITTPAQFMEALCKQIGEKWVPPRKEK